VRLDTVYFSVVVSYTVGAKIAFFPR